MEDRRLYSRDVTYRNEAQRLIDLGWKVFPLTPAGGYYKRCQPCTDGHMQVEEKETCTCTRCHGFYAARTDTSGWDGDEDSLIGIRTGAAPGSGIVVLDFDDHHDTKPGVELFRRMRADGKLPPTVEAASGGGGIHLYYRHPGAGTYIKSGSDRLGLGGDVRGDLALIVAPPSHKVGAATPYSWQPGHSPWEHEIAALPLELLELLTRTRQISHSRTASSGDTRGLTRRYEDAVQRLLHQPDTPGEIGRNDLLYEASCRAGEAVEAGALNETDARCELADVADRVGLSPTEIPKTIQSGFEEGSRDYLRPSLPVAKARQAVASGMYLPRGM